MCERPVDGFSWSPPGRALQADALRELVAVHDVVLQGAFPELRLGKTPTDKKYKERELFITGIFLERGLFFITVLY